MKKYLLMGLMGTALLAGCSAGNTSPEGEVSSSSAAQESSAASLESNEEATISYTGTVKKSEADYGNGLLVADLTPIDHDDAAEYDEVVLLMDEKTPLTNQATGEKMKPEDLAEGDKLHVTLAENAPMTLSIPPQVSGEGIVKVEVEK